jgi:hypothetical protein
MPIHDWTRVSAGTWHAFHLSWISEVQAALNAGVLPDDYYAQAEQIAGPFGPDVLTLQEASGQAGEAPGADSGGVAVAVTPPRARLTAQTEINEYAQKKHTLIIRHASGDRIVALLELISPGKKASRNALRSFVEKAAGALAQGYHLLIVDIFPPTRRDPQGVHGAIWEEIADDSYVQPADEPLTLVAYAAGSIETAYIEPTAVGRELMEMPLFLTSEIYINVPLEATYRAAFRGVPRKWREVLEAPG